MELRPARPDDLERLREIEVAAGTLFEGTVHAEVAAHAAPPVEELAGAAAIIVAVDGDDRPVGYARIELVGGGAHLEQLSVDPAAGRAGVGTALLDAVSAWSADHGDGAVTLTTFRAVPFNQPYYERRGYVTLDDAALPPALRALVAEEAHRGLDPATRVVMRRG